MKLHPLRLSVSRSAFTSGIELGSTPVDTLNLDLIAKALGLTLPSGPRSIHERDGMLRLYDSRLSGNSWKVRILLNQLKRPFQRISLELEQGEAKTEAFTELNRFARVPVLQLSDGRTIVESAAILLNLAEGSDFLFDDPYLNSQALGWMFYEQGDLQKYLAWPRVYHIRGMADANRERIFQLQSEGYKGLDKLELWLEQHSWLVGERYSVADIAVFGYVSLATEGGYDMERFPAINRWLDLVKSQHGWLPIFANGNFETD